MMPLPAHGPFHAGNTLAFSAFKAAALDFLTCDNAFDGCRKILRHIIGGTPCCNDGGFVDEIRKVSSVKPGVMPQFFSRNQHPGPW
jgi:hypothetical protein